MALSSPQLIAKPLRVILTPRAAGWVDDAWHRSGRRARLLQATTTDRFAIEFADLHAAVPVFGPGLPQRTPDADVALVVDLDDELQDLKLAALRAQATQTHGLLAAIGEDRFRAWWREETFVAADRASRPTDLQDLTTPSPSLPRLAPSASTTKPQAPPTNRKDRGRCR